MNKDNQQNKDDHQNKDNSDSEQIPERIEPIFQADHIVKRSIDKDICQTMEKGSLNE